MHERLGGVTTQMTTIIITWRRRQHVPPKLQHPPTRLQDAITPKSSHNKHCYENIKSRTFFIKFWWVLNSSGMLAEVSSTVPKSRIRVWLGKCLCDFIVNNNRNHRLWRFERRIVSWATSSSVWWALMVSLWSHMVNVLSCQFSYSLFCFIYLQFMVSSPYFLVYF
jgi:hypothetical protein